MEGFQGWQGVWELGVFVLVRYGEGQFLGCEEEVYGVRVELFWFLVGDIYFGGEGWVYLLQGEVDNVFFFDYYFEVRYLFSYVFLGFNFQGVFIQQVIQYFFQGVLRIIVFVLV